MVEVPNETWYSIIDDWLAESEDLLVEFAIAGSCGAEGYTFCRSADSVKEFVSTLPSATRIYIYKHHNLILRGTVDEDFIVRARQHMPSNGDFLVISFATRLYSLGYDGYLGDTLIELEEILDDLKGEHVAFGPSPAADAECKPIVAYKDGIVGSY